MSEITLKYKLTADDLVKFNFIALSRKIRFQRIACLAAALIFGIEFVVLFEDIVSAVLTAAVFLVAGLSYPAVLKAGIKKQHRSSKFTEHEIQLEFYNDHIVEKILPSERSGLCGENHFPFEKILNITESDELFMFFISPVEAIIAPKASMTPEDRRKLFCLINNVFSDRFTRIDLRKAMREDKSNNEKRG